MGDDVRQLARIVLAQAQDHLLLPAGITLAKAPFFGLDTLNHKH
jgi:hypothetical protein